MALRNIRDWCGARDLPFVIVLWPFLQGLEDRETYPFTTVHEELAAFCQEEQIPLLDLLDTLEGQDSTSLWVAPNDPHGNPTCQKLVSPAIADFVRGVLE